MLLDPIDTGARSGLPRSPAIGLHGDTFARVGAVGSMKVEDYYIQKRRGWMPLHEKDDSPR